VAVVEGRLNCCEGTGQLWAKRIGCPVRGSGGVRNIPIGRGYTGAVGCLTLSMTFPTWKK